MFSINEITVCSYADRYDLKREGPNDAGGRGDRYLLGKGPCEETRNGIQRENEGIVLE